MLTPNWEQYREVLDLLERPLLSTTWEKYDRYRWTAEILWLIFDENTWKEWDENYALLQECYHKMIDPNEVNLEKYEKVHGWKYPDWFQTPQIFPRETTYLMQSLTCFWADKIFSCLSADVLYTSLL